MPLRLSLLGSLGVERDGAVVELPASKKTRALLAYLVLTGREHRRERLCTLLWDVADDPRAALRWVLSRLRTVVDEPGRPRIVATRAAVAFDSEGTEVDVLSIRRRLARGVEDIPTAELVSLAGSLESELLEALDLPDFDDYQTWYLAERESVTGLRVQVLEALVGRHREDAAAQLPWARQRVQCQPLREEVRADLVRTMLALGRYPEAEQQVSAGCRALEEVGRRPSGALRAALRLPSGSVPVPEVRRATAPALEARPPVVGREREQDALRRWLLTAGNPPVMLLSGEAGIGKTCLLDYVAAHHEGVVLAGAAHEAEVRPWGPWLDAFASGGLAALHGRLAGAEASATREQLLDRIGEGLAAQASGRRLLLVLDDVQWCDPASAELLHAVQRLAPEVALLLAARSGELDDNTAMIRVLRALRRRGRLVEMPVGPLAPGAVEALVHGLDPRRATSDVVSRSGGNPLFAIELARTAPGGDVPPTLSSLVRDRLASLSPDAASTLRWAAVLGTSFGLGCLGRLAVPERPSDLLRALEELERHGVVAPHPHPPSPRATYRFTHELLRSVVYEDLSDPRKRLMHARAVEAYAAGEVDEPDVVGEIVRHAALAQDDRTAAEACVRAGWRHLRVHATTEAAALARRGLHHAERLPEPAATERVLELWELLLAASRADDPDPVANQLVDLAERAMDQGSAEHARLGFHLASYVRWDSGHLPDAHRVMMRAELASRASDGPGHAIAQAESAKCLLLLEKNLAEAEALVLHADAEARRKNLEHPSVPHALGMLHLHRGLLDRAELSFGEARRLAVRSGDAFAEFEAIEYTARLQIGLGQLDRARVSAADLVRIGDKLRGGSEAPYARTVLALVAWMADPSAPQSVVDFDLAIESLRVADARQRLAQVLGQAAMFALADGDRGLAVRWATEALEHATHMDRPSPEAVARVVLARADVAGRASHLPALTSAMLSRCSAEAQALVRELVG